MKKIKLFADSTCDLSDEILQKYDISIIPLYVNFEEKTFKDRLEITTEALYKKVDEYGVLPKTAAPALIDFHNAFSPYVDEGREILYIGISSFFSSTLQNAIITKDSFPEAKIEIVDSLNLSSGEGLLILKAVDLINEGLDLEEIAHKLRGYTHKIKTSFVIDTMDYLYKGGRCTALQHFVSSLLKIRPIIKVFEGKMIVGEKIRGKIEKGWDFMLKEAIACKGRIDSNRILVTHSMSYDGADYIKAELEKSLDNPEVIITEAGCVISSHCGKNTIGILFIED